MKCLSTLMLVIALATACGKITPQQDPPEPSNQHKPEPQSVERHTFDDVFYKKLDDGHFRFLSNMGARGNWATGRSEGPFHTLIGICANLSLSTSRSYLLQLAVTPWDRGTNYTDGYEGLDMLTLSGEWNYAGQDEIELSAIVDKVRQKVGKIKMTENKTPQVLLTLNQGSFLRLFAGTGFGRENLTLNGKSMLLDVVTLDSDFGAK